MKIVMDARFLGPEGTGIGRYIGKLLENLEEVDKKNDYWVVLRSSNFDLYNPKNPNFRKVIADARWYGFKEQFLVPRILLSLKPDLVHFPHFNVPVAYLGKFVVTIHDLIGSEYRSTESTTRAPLVYWAKHFIYERVVRQAVGRAEKVIVPTNTIKDKVSKQLSISADKIAVTYEAADEKFFTWGEDKSLLTRKSEDIFKKYGVKSPYLVCAGNAFPYKNLDRLLESLSYLPKEMSFVNPSPKSAFQDRLREKAEKLGVGKRLILPGFVTDEELSVLYHNAVAYVMPSLSEGFGLPALEAMASKLPVIISDIPVLREVCGDNVLYVDPNNPQDIAEKIKKLMSDQDLRQRLINEGLERVRQFSWRKTAAQTLQVYEEALK